MSSSIFDPVAHAYDRHRPGYPDRLYSDLIELTGLTPRSKVLEVGVGTGKATRGLAARGIPVLGLEPGPDMAARARANFEAFSHIKIATETFESCPLESGSFDLVYSAQAFHWVAPEVRFVKASQVLKGERVPGHLCQCPAETGQRARQGHGRVLPVVRAVASRNRSRKARLDGVGILGQPALQDPSCTKISLVIRLFGG